MSTAISNVAICCVIIAVLASCALVSISADERVKAIALACINSGGEWDETWRSCKRGTA